MTWRIVVIASSAKLELNLNRLVIRNENIEKINLSEINTIIVESTATAVTSALMVELVKRKINVVFCDEKRNPCFSLESFYGSHDTSLKVRNQITWSQYSKDAVWTEIIKNKIAKQRELLEENGILSYQKLDEYLREITFKDETNREGHAAKVYFNSLFGHEFNRNDENPVNASLNYGYTIILSLFNRTIVSMGYMTQFGLFHDNMFNNFNLSSDLMEPFRILVDREVLKMNVKKFDKEVKVKMVSILANEIYIDGKKQTVTNAINIYVHSVFSAIEKNDINLIKFYRNEL